MKEMNKKCTAEAPVKALIEAIRNLHGCEATWVESVPVKETFQGKTVWEGEVQVFEVKGHPAASRCYAWSYVSDEKTGKRKFFTVLHQGPVDSPHAAVRAAIVAEYRQKEV
jgi:hypothetical protein